MHPATTPAALAALAAALLLVLAHAASPAPAAAAGSPASQAAARPDPVLENAAELVARGRRVFRSDTLGSEAFWGDTLGLHETLAGAPGGGVGPGVSPNEALALGLKVDLDALPPELVAGLLRGTVDLDDPATTLALLDLDAVVGVKGFFEGRELASVGITCALCHSTVDDALVPGIGRRLDGWPNRDLDAGAVIALAQDLSFFTTLLGVDEPTVEAVLASWGPGKFDAHLILDGQAFRPDGESAAVLIPAAFGLGGVNLTTYTGWGGLGHWNALVGNLEMGGLGRFWDPRLDDPVQFPVAAAAGLGDVTDDEDRVTPVLHALQMYQLALPVPEPPADSFDPEAAARGAELFAGAAGCATCHVPPLFTEPGWNLHTPEEVGIDGFQASRSPTGRYRTTPLGGLFTRAQGGFYHDGRFADLAAVVEHYDATFALGLTDPQKDDLVAYLKSL